VWSNWQFALGSYDRNAKVFVPASEILIGPWLCSQRLARATLSVPADVPNMKLDTLCQFFGHGGQGEIHGAEKDAILAGRLYWSLRDKRKAAAA
jgi:DNA polymerase III epsilon subunit-like protein